MNSRKHHHDYDEQNAHVFAWLSQRYARLGLVGNRISNSPARRRFKAVTVDGKRFDCMSDAARFIGGTCAGLSMAMRRGAKYRGYGVRLDQRRRTA